MADDKKAIVTSCMLLNDIFPGCKCDSEICRQAEMNHLTEASYSQGWLLCYPTQKNVTNDWMSSKSCTG